MPAILSRVFLPAILLMSLVSAAVPHAAQACEDGKPCEHCEKSEKGKDGKLKCHDGKCDKCQGQKGHGMMGGGWMRGLMALEGPNKLTEEQHAKIKALMPTPEDKGDDRQSMKDVHKVMANALLAEGAVDESVVTKARADIDAAHKQKMDAMTQTYRKIREILTPAQRAALAKARAERAANKDKDKDEYPTCDEHKKDGKKGEKGEGRKERDMEHKH